MAEDLKSCGEGTRVLQRGASGDLTEAGGEPRHDDDDDDDDEGLRLPQRGVGMRVLQRGSPLVCSCTFS